MDESKRYRQGMKVRRAVLGEAHVNRAESTKNTFNEPFQDLITRYAWGEIWRRPGLPRKTRSLVTIGMMVALNRPEELRLHLRAAAIDAARLRPIRSNAASGVAFPVLFFHHLRSALRLQLYVKVAKDIAVIGAHFERRLGVGGKRHVYGSVHGGKAHHLVGRNAIERSYYTAIHRMRHHGSGSVGDVHGSIRVVGFNLA